MLVNSKLFNLSILWTRIGLLVIINLQGLLNINDPSCHDGAVIKVTRGHAGNELHWLSLLYIVLTLSILLGRAPAYFQNSRIFLNKHYYSIISVLSRYICRFYREQCAWVIHLWLKSASTLMVSSDATVSTRLTWTKLQPRHITSLTMTLPWQILKQW